jgi:amino acid permease
MLIVVAILALAFAMSLVGIGFFVIMLIVVAILALAFAMSLVGIGFFVIMLIVVAILALAFAMSLVGIGFFVIMLIVVAILALYAVHLLLELCDQTNVKSYERLGYIAFGRMGRIVTAIFILVQNMGAMASYLYIVKYELPNVLMTLLGKVENNGESYLNGDLLIIVITIAIILPLSSLRTIGILGYASGFSISCMFFFLCVIIYKMFHIPCPLYDDVLFQHWDTVGNLSV